MKEKDKKISELLDGLDEGTVLFHAVRVEGGIEVGADEVLTSPLLAALLSGWLDQPGIKAKYGDVFIALATQLVEERMVAERIAKWGRGFRTGKEEIS